MIKLMDRESTYYQQVALLIRMLPVVVTESVFAPKGGTAINLFIRDLFCLLIDIDLAYLPLKQREEALTNAKSALRRIADSIYTQPDLAKSSVSTLHSWYITPASRILRSEHLSPHTPFLLNPLGAKKHGIGPIFAIQCIKDFH